MKEEVNRAQPGNTAELKQLIRQFPAAKLAKVYTVSFIAR